jgi:transposase InsO family protein
MTKLNKKRVKWLVDQVVKHDKRPKDVCLAYSISQRRVQQLVKTFRESKRYPELKDGRRPKTFLSPEQEQAIEQAYKETLLTPRMLYYELLRRSVYAPKNKMYQYLKTRGWVRDEPNEQKKRKRCRYEWPHTGDMLHSDYHRTSVNHPHCIFWLDDHCRKILSGAECSSPNAETALKTFKEAQAKLKPYFCSVLRVNTDRAIVFLSNKNKGKSKFEEYCNKEGIRLIPSRAKNPQTNGKVERRWLEYDKHRWRFKKLQDWIDWHNNRLTTSLDIQHYETPNDAFLRGLPNIAALFWRLVENGQTETK